MRLLILALASGFALLGCGGDGTGGGGKADGAAGAGGGQGGSAGANGARGGTVGAGLTGGAGGASASNGGSAGTGARGVAGAAGTGTPAGGAGGTGTTATGAGGTAAPGAGGAGGAGVPICPGQNPPQGTGTLFLCEECGLVYCCTEAQACAADANCVNLEVCLQRCQPSDQLCVYACENLYPGSVGTYDNLVNCNSQECYFSCDTPPPGCTNVALGTNGGCDQTEFGTPWDCPNGPPEAECVAAPAGDPDEYCCLF